MSMVRSDRKGDVEALVRPFEAGILNIPDRSFFFRAQPSPALAGAWHNALVCEQTFKPTYDALARAGFAVSTEVSGEYGVGLCLLTKHRAENLANIARGWSLLSRGGTLVCSGAKGVGGASIEKAVDKAAGLSGRMSKYHARVFWLTKRGQGMPEEMTAWLDVGGLKANVEGRYLTRPGIFSWDRPDAGSALLLRAAPEEIGGRIADLGAGWGYLSLNLVRTHPKITAIDLYEAELLALEAARRNAIELGGPEPRFFWHDVSTGLDGNAGYDWIVTNPPHHAGRDVSHDLGRSFIRAAAPALRPKGKLLLVANRQLPYESELAEHFGHTEVLTQDSRFKVLLAERK